MKCYVCEETNLIDYFDHKEWKKKICKCNSCGHVALYNTIDNKKSSGQFVTKSRANRYIGYLKNVTFESILEIGTPDDLYFLKEIHKSHPNTKLYGFDKTAPNYIDMISLGKSFKDDNDVTTALLNKLTYYDIIYCTHVLEHVPNINKFIDIINYCKYFIIEIPCNNQGYFDNRHQLKRTAHHYQFFTTDTFIQFVKNHDIKCIVIHSWDQPTPYNKGNLIMTNIDNTFSNNYKILYNSL